MNADDFPPALRKSAQSADVRDPQTYAIIGAAMEVHRQLGHGFLEAVYQEALAVEFAERAIPFQREAELPIRYKGRVLACKYRADFLCYDAVAVETKALATLTTVDEAQLINELKATGYAIGLLINFGAPSLEYRRRIFTQNLSPQIAPTHADLKKDIVD